MTTKEEKAIKQIKSAVATIEIELACIKASLTKPWKEKERDTSFDGICCKGTGIIECPHCGEKAETDDDVVILRGGEYDCKFVHLLANSKVNKGVFMCKKCDEMFQIPSNRYIRIVK